MLQDDIMPSPHRPMYLIVDKKNGVKIASCAPNVGPLIYQTFPSDNLSAMKNRIVCSNFSPTRNQSDINQQCHCHNTLTTVKISD